MRAKAQQGFVAGGLVFGHDNQRLGKGQTVRVPNPVESEVVRDIFRRFVSGDGLRTIAEALNRAKAPCPRSQLGRAAGWSRSTVREVLMRPLYRGEIVYGRTKSAYGRELGRRLIREGKKREKAQLPTAEDTWIRHVDERLRIVDADLAARADEKRLGRRDRYFASLKGGGGRVPEGSASSSQLGVGPFYSRAIMRAGSAAVKAFAYTG